MLFRSGSTVHGNTENCFLMACGEDFSSAKDLESREYFVYFLLSKSHGWRKRFLQGAKGQFLGLPKSKIALGQSKGDKIDAVPP